ncbi:hypothetical protein B9P84_18170 [Citrobacter braakii]|uniref:DUF5347 family protein n=1 Tax=Citrobacter braakii TaxID=57706 RepID=UPI000B9C13BF|nr:DUF5347 family protein [Citrobacter braakii]MDL4385810.1 DUF5347 family protein [Citrobacter braakii]OXU10514.1 hypothetical protein B9P84_18170 [Citrobacter braakii]
MNTTTDIQAAEAVIARLPEHRPAAWDRQVLYSLDEKINGLNCTAKVRGKLFEKKDCVNGKEINAGMTVFLKEMRSTINNRERDNGRVLNAIFFLAEIDKKKHNSEFDELSEDEQISLIEAINQIKAVTSIFPTDLAIK